MKNRMGRTRFVGSLLILAVAVLFVGQNAVFAKGGKGGNAAETRVEGILVNVDTVASNVSIGKASGVTVLVPVNANTKIERNGRRVPLSALKVGDRAQARISTATGLTTKLESTGL